MIFTRKKIASINLFILEHRLHIPNGGRGLWHSISQTYCQFSSRFRAKSVFDDFKNSVSLTYRRIVGEGRGLQNFLSDEVAHRYINDPVNVTEWCLVYNNRPAFVLYLVYLCISMTVTAIVVLFLADYFATDGKFSLKFFTERREHLYQLSYFGVVPFLVAMFSCSLIYRQYRMLLFRIYVNRGDSDKLKIFLSSGRFDRVWRDIKRTDIIADPFFATDPSLTGAESFKFAVRKFFTGSIRINGRPFFLNADAFRSNKLLTFSVNFTDNRPEDLDHMDLDILNIKKKK